MNTMRDNSKAPMLACAVSLLLAASAATPVRAETVLMGDRGGGRSQSAKRADFQVHLRPVHRAFGTLYLRGAVGGNAGGSEVLLPGYRGSTRLDHVSARQAILRRRRASLRIADPIALDDRGR